MSVNVPLLRKYVEWVEEQEARKEGREWLQRYWAVHTGHQRQRELTVDLDADFCDTAYCLAGKVATDHGWQPVWQVGEARMVEKNGRQRNIPGLADELLGLVGDHSLFNGDNTAADIRRIAEDLAGERL